MLQSSQSLLPSEHTRFLPAPGSLERHIPREDAHPTATSMFKGITLTVDHTGCRLGCAIIAPSVISTGRVNACLLWSPPFTLNGQKKKGSRREETAELLTGAWQESGSSWSKMLGFPKSLPSTLCLLSLTCSVSTDVLLLTCI